MGSMEVRGEDVQQRSYWRCSKQDFLPEESFQNWSTYRTALSQTGHRFKNRLLSRSNDNDEIGELRKQSENDMKRCLTWWDLMWFGFGSVIGAGIFVLTGLETQRHAGPAIVLSYVASGLSAMLSVFCYTEFSIEIPVAGGAFAYLRIELGDFVAFITAGNILLESIVGSAGLARAWTSYFTALLNHPSNSLRIHTNLAEGFNLLDPIAVTVLVAVGALKGMTTVLLVGTLGQARYITHIARAHMIPPWFALVHPKTGTPINATVLIAISSSCIAFFSSLEVLTGLLSVSTLFIFMMMAVALLVRRYYVKDITPKHHLLNLVIFLLIIIASSMGTAAYWGLNPNGWVGYVVTVPLWFFGTLVMAVFLPQQRSPKLWGVPLVPWLPSLSIATNIFLMGSLGPEAFERFGICTVVMLIYYVFFGLHATYDVAHKQDMPQESRTALSQTGHRFKNRLLSRSNDNDEIGELRKQSENDMKRCLTWWDLIWFGFGSVLGAGIFVLTGQETHTHAGPAIVLSYVISGLSAMLSVFSYTEFSVEIPAAGGAFAYLRIELGDFVAFITAGNILLEGIIVSAVAARAWTSYFTSLLNRPSDSLRIHTNLAAGFKLQQLQ